MDEFEDFMRRFPGRRDPGHRGGPPHGHPRKDIHLTPKQWADDAEEAGSLDWADWEKRSRQTPIEQLAASLAGFVCPIGDVIDGAQAAGRHCDEHDEEWRNGVEEWYSRRGGFTSNIWDDEFLAGN